MIGALARFEERFGHLWEKEGDPTSDSLHEIWQEVRSNILNFGNHQTRIAVEDMYRYFLDNQQENNGKYYYELKFKNKGDNQ